MNTNIYTDIERIFSMYVNNDYTTVQQVADDYGDEDTEIWISEFCVKYHLSSDTYDYLYGRYEM